MRRARSDAGGHAARATDGADARGLRGHGRPASSGPRLPALRRAAALAALVLAGAALTACEAKSAPPAADAWQRALAGLGIATVPFEGGAPLQPVDGDIVLVLTDWQAASLAAGLPEPVGDPAERQDAPTAADATAAADDAGATDAGAAEGSGAAPTGAPADAPAPVRFTGIPSPVLDAIAPDPGDDPLTTSGIVAAWWQHADTARARAARDLLAPTAAIPAAVLALFVADALGDAGRTLDPQAAQPQAFAAAVGGLAGPDPCGTISDAIGSVNAFLDGMGELGTVIRGALEQAYGALDALTGTALTAVKRAIAVANVVLNMGSLLTPWKVQWTTAPAVALEVGLNGAPGTEFHDTVRLVGVAGQPPAAVQSCLGVLGIHDPTSQKGTALEWQFQPGYLVEVPGGLIVPGPPPPVLGDDNAATLDLTTGLQTLDAKKRSPRFGTGDVIVSMRRADAARVTDYLRSLGGGLVGGLLGGALEQVATAIELAVNPFFEVRQHVVRYWVPDETPDPPTPTGAAPPPPQAAPPVDTPIECSLSAHDVEQVSGRTVTSVRYGEFGEGDPLSATGPGGAVRACLYDVSGGGMIVIADAVYPEDPTAVDPGFTGILTDGFCNRASGHLELGPDVYGYLVWSGHALRGTYFFQLGSSDPSNVLPTLARAAGMC